MQIGASKYPVNLSVCFLLSLRKFCVLAPSDVTSKHAKRKQNSLNLERSVSLVSVSYYESLKGHKFFQYIPGYFMDFLLFLPESSSELRLLLQATLRHQVNQMFPRDEKVISLC